MILLDVDEEALKKVMADIPELDFLAKLKRFQRDNVSSIGYAAPSAAKVGFGRLKSLAKIAGTETRLRVLLALTKSDMNVVALAKSIGVSASTLTEHLGILENEGVVASRSQGRMRIYGLVDSEETRELAKLVKAWSSI